MPSRCPEAAGLAALESMASGTPVVAYAQGGLGEYVSDASAGRVVAKDPQNLARACRELYGSRASWEAASKGGLFAISTTHSVDRYISRLEGVYEHAASGPPT